MTRGRCYKCGRFISLVDDDGTGFYMPVVSEDNTPAESLDEPGAMLEVFCNKICADLLIGGAA